MRRSIRKDGIRSGRASRRKKTMTRIFNRSNVAILIVGDFIKAEGSNYSHINSQKPISQFVVGEQQKHMAIKNTGIVRQVFDLSEKVNVVAQQNKPRVITVVNSIMSLFVTCWRKSKRSKKGSNEHNVITRSSNHSL